MSFQERYKSGNPPWEIHRADYNLINMVRDTPILPCDALDVGCGTGSNAIWLRQQDFTVVGVDSSEIAIERAREKARRAEVDCKFHVLDFLDHDIPGAPFDFVFDRGCFHHFLEYDKLGQFAEKVAMVLKDGGLWLTLTGSADETREGPGPPQLSARQIADAAEPFFEILSLASKHFDTDQPVPAKNWVCLSRKRAETSLYA